MKVLYYTNLPSPYKVSFLNELSKYCDVDALFTLKDEEERNDAWYKDNEYKFKAFYLDNNGYSLIKELLNNKYDIVINANYATKYGAYLSNRVKQLNIPLFINADGGIIYPNEYIKNIIRKFFIKKGDYYLSSGKETNKYFIFHGANKDKIYTYNFSSLTNNDILDTPISYEDKLKLRRQNDYDYKRIFISVGSLIDRKGYDIFFKAIKDINLKDTLFLIVGSGQKEEEYKMYIEDNNLDNVRLLGFKSKKEVFDLYKLADVFFLPSREDIWGLVINEAMANGLPVISSDNVVASKELINEKYLYNPEDVDRLKDLIIYFNNLDDNNLYDIGNRNLKTIKDYTIENMAKRYYEVFNEVLKDE